VADTESRYAVIRLFGSEDDPNTEMVYYDRASKDSWLLPMHALNFAKTIPESQHPTVCMEHTVTRLCIEKTIDINKDKLRDMDEMIEYLLGEVIGNRGTMRGLLHMQLWQWLNELRTIHRAIRHEPFIPPPAWEEKEGS
jgi:hypothetical protein